MKQQPKVPAMVPAPAPAPAVPMPAAPVVFARTLTLAAAFVAWGVGLTAVTGCGGRKDRAQTTATTEQGLPLQTFARQWATDLALRGDTLDELHVRPDTIYAYTDRGRVVSLARDSGALQFSRLIKGGGTLLHEPVVVDDKMTLPSEPDPTTAVPVIFPTATTLEILDKGTGRFVRSVNVDFTIRSDAVGRGAMVYVGGAYRRSSRAAALDIRQPYVAVQWELMTPGGAISAKPGLWEDAVYFGGEDGSVYAVSAAAREPIWPLPGGVFRTGGPIVADLVVDADSVYVASTDNKLYALNRNSGRIQWQYYAGAALRTGPTVTSDTVYQYVPGTGLVAIDKSAGQPIRQPRWVADDATQLLSVDERNAYVRTRANRIAAHDKKTGQRLFTSQRRDLAVFGTNVAKEDGIIYAATKRGRVIAVRPVLKPGTVGEVVMVGSDE